MQLFSLSNTTRYLYSFKLPFFHSPFNDAAYTAGTAQALSGASETLTIEFGWGSAFEKDSVNVNPYTYFNAKENNDTNRTEAVTKLGGLQEAVNGATFTITITVTPAAQA